MIFLNAYEIEKRSIKDLNYTIIKSEAIDSKIIFVHIPGFNDYIFNKDLMNRLNIHNISFYGVELHNYGRNINKNTKKKYYFDNIDDCLIQINDAINYLKKDRKVILSGHSMGGLLAFLYLKKYKNIDALFLNSPFFKFNVSFLQYIGLYLMSFSSKFFEDLYIQADEVNLYGITISNRYRGEWEIDERYKDIVQEPKIYFSWIRAILQGQNEVEYINTQIPILTLISDKSSNGKNENLLFKSDIVLNVEDIEKISYKLSPNTKLFKIKDALHNVFLSKKEVRDKAYKQFFIWMYKNFKGTK